MTLPRPAPGELWLAYLHFEDKPELGKVRPVLVIEARVDALIVVVAKVTSKDLSHRGAPAVEIAGWQACGLRKPSWVRLDQRFELPLSDMLRDEPIGRVSNETFALVESALQI